MTSLFSLSGYSSTPTRIHPLYRVTVLARVKFNFWFHTANQLGFVPGFPGLKRAMLTIELHSIDPIWISNCDKIMLKKRSFIILNWPYDIASRRLFVWIFGLDVCLSQLKKNTRRQIIDPLLRHTKIIPIKISVLLVKRLNVNFSWQIYYVFSPSNRFFFFS